MTDQFKKRHIVIVDDNKTNLLFNEKLLKEANFTHLSLASSARELFKIVKNELVDLILLDIMMPEIDGIDACKALKKEPKYSDIPIIMVTADQSDETLQRSFQAGAQDYVTKPVNKTNLTARINNLFMHKHKDALLLNQNRLLAVNDTVHMLAHQWRQPLSVINTTVMNMSIGLESDDIDVDQLQEGFACVTSSTQSLSKTLDMFCQITNNSNQLLLHSVNETVSMSIELVKSRFEAYDVHFETHLEEIKEISYVPNEIVKILIGIYINALEAYKKSKSDIKKIITVSTVQSHVSTTIVIKDCAGGIDEKILPKVFEPYVSTKEKKNGVGLGLYNAYNILSELMQGVITITSKNSQTEVKIKLPNKRES